MIRNKKKGQGLVEYALIISLIALAAIGSLVAFSTQFGATLTTYITALNEAK